MALHRWAVGSWRFEGKWRPHLQGSIFRNLLKKCRWTKENTNETTESPWDGSHQPPAVASATATAAAAVDDDYDERYKHKKAWSITHLQKTEFSDLCLGRLLQCPSYMICILNSNTVVKVLNHFNLFLCITDETKKRVFYKTLKQRPQFKTSYNCTQFILRIYTTGLKMALRGRKILRN